MIVKAIVRAIVTSRLIEHEKMNTDLLSLEQKIDELVVDHQVQEVVRELDLEVEVELEVKVEVEVEVVVEVVVAHQEVVVDNHRKRPNRNLEKRKKKNSVNQRKKQRSQKNA